MAPLSLDIKHHLESIQAGGEGLKVFASAPQLAAAASSSVYRANAADASFGDALVQPPPTLARRFISKVTCFFGDSDNNAVMMPMRQHFVTRLINMTIFPPSPYKVFDSGGNINESPPTMFHPRHSSISPQEQHAVGLVSAAHDTHPPDVAASASSAFPTLNTASTLLDHRSIPSSASLSPLPSNSSSVPSEPPLNRQSMLQQQHRVTQMQLVRSSGNITVVSAAAAGTSSSKIDVAQSGTGISVAAAASAPATATAAAPAPDVAAVLAETLMAKMQVRVGSCVDGGVARISYGA